MRRLRVLLVLILGLAATPDSVHAHIRLESASPGPGDSVIASPDRLRLRFSALIEASYTSLNLIAPNGQLVAIGTIEFTEGSDREFTVLVPPLTMPGTYTVRWRTAGADGHVLNGSYTFALLPDTTALAPVDTAGMPITEPVSAPVFDEHDHGGDTHATTAADIAARWLHFSSLLLLIGCFASRVLLVPRLDLHSSAREPAVRSIWRAAAFTAVALIIAAIVRLWLQSVALHGSDGALSTRLLSMMLTDTSWGRAWLIQAVCLAVLGAGIAWARPINDTLALTVAIPALLGLSAMPGLTGHAAGVGPFSVINDAVHVLAAGVWLGTLVILTVYAMPALVRAQAGGRTVADIIASFTPIALTAAAVVVCTGVINALQHFSDVGQLTGTAYGRALLLKLAFVGLVFVAGFVNWRVVRPRLLGDAGDTRRLRVSVSAEILFAVLVLAATALLTGVQRP